MRKLLSILLAVVMVMAFVMPAMATGETESTGHDLLADAYDMTYYVGGYGAMPNRYQCQVRYTDSGYSEWFDISFGDPIVAEWPTEAGTYTVTFDKTTTIEGAGDTEYTFIVSMNITVLELPATSGKCGDNMTWRFDTTSDTLTISGTGDMYTVAESDEDFQNENYNYEPGWWYFPVKHIVIEEGVENLANYAFTQGAMNNYYEILETIQLPTTLKAIPELGFLMADAMTSLTIPEGITSLTGWPFGYPGNSFLSLTELYLPSTLTEMDILTICLGGFDGSNFPALSLKKIHFAGTEEQWNSIQQVMSDVIAEILGEGAAEWYSMFAEPYAQVEIVFEPKEDAKEETEIPTSGKLGENITWKYDAATDTITLSGTGTVYDIYNDATNEAANAWHEAYLQLSPSHVIVEEGIEVLGDAIFAFSPHLLDISLPTTLKEIPLALVGLNGPMAEMDDYYLETYGDVPGMTAINIPEGITSLTNHFTYTCWGISDYYLPSTLTEIDLDALCYVAAMRINMGVAALNTTIYFAGTEEQWVAIKHVVGETRANYGTGLTDEELEDLLSTFTIVFEPKENAKEEITVEDGTANIPDSSVEITEGEDVVIDVTDTKEEVSSVVIGSETVDKIADAETVVEIKLPDATVSFDKTAFGSIGEQAGETAVTIVAKEVEETTLTTEQKAALEEKEVCAILNLEAYAGEKKITEFDGGKVTISVPFELPEGKAGTDYYVAYVADDGTITAMPTTYADGVLSFETTHFSSYVVLENKTVTPEPTPDPSNPQTGDNSHLMLFVVLMVISPAALVACTTKRKAIQ